jgi:protein-L-isoaspartate(D-aspartate) O-methyltransferase
MNIEQVRFNMIEQQIRPWDVLEQDVLDLLVVVKREDFVPAAYKTLAFADTQIPLPGGECMLTPKLEARILQEVALKKHEHVLEIGAGSGYMAALLGHKARYVTSVEINPVLKAFAENNLARYDLVHVDVVLGNGAQGWTGAGHNKVPYDVIVISGSLPVLPEVFLSQLKIGGRIFAIIGAQPAMSAQIITRVSDSLYNTVNIFETDVKALRDAIVPSHFKF